MGFLKPSRKQAAVAQQEATVTANENKAREDTRAIRLKEGSDRINSQFDSIGSDFYDNAKAGVVTTGMSDLTDQWNKARENLMYALARSGMLSSTEANRGATEIQDKFNQGAAKIDLQGRDAANALKNNVETERAGAISQLYATENPDLAANNAMSKAALITQQKPDYNPLGDIFSGVVNAFDSYQAAKNRGGAIGGGASASPNTSLKTNSNGFVIGGA